MLLVRVFVDAGLCAPFDPRPYPVDWHLHRSEERYLGFVFDRSREDHSAAAGRRHGLRYGRCYSHGGIVTNADPLTIVHAYYPARCVVEEEIARNAVLSDAARKPRFFSLWTGTEESAVSIFRSGVQAAGGHAGLYRAADPDGGERAAGADRLG